MATATATPNVLTVAQTEFINRIGAVKMPRFIAINGYQNKEGDITNYLININHKYSNKVKKDVGQLKSFIKNLAKTPETALHYMAASELLQSFLNNADKETASNQSKAQAEAYNTINGAIKQHNETGKFYLFGYLVSKQVLVKAERKPVNSRALTLAKNEIKRTLRTSKYVNFSLELTDFSVTVQGSTLILTSKEYKPKAEPKENFSANEVDKILSDLAKQVDASAFSRIQEVRENLGFKPE